MYDVWPSAREIVRASARAETRVAWLRAASSAWGTVADRPMMMTNPTTMTRYTTKRAMI
jgi:hypothetical protein